MARPRRTALLVFALEPASETKSLGLGRARDRDLHTCLLAQTLAVARRAADKTPLLLASNRPPERVDADHLDYIPQRGADFEERFVNALDDAFARGFERLVVIGSDTPALRASDLCRALASPAGHGWSSS